MWKRTGIIVVVAGLLLLALVRCSTREPSYAGRTVTQWLDRLVLYDYREESSSVSTIYRAPEVITNDVAFRALLQIGVRGVPILVQRIQDRAEWAPTVPPFKRLRQSVEWRWNRLFRRIGISRPGPQGWS